MLIESREFICGLWKCGASCYGALLVFSGALLSLEFYDFEPYAFDVYISNVSVFGTCICFW